MIRQTFLQHKECRDHKRKIVKEDFLKCLEFQMAFKEKKTHPGRLYLQQFLNKKHLKCIKGTLNSVIKRQLKF